jgi:hypothetical protein
MGEAMDDLSMRGNLLLFLAETLVILDKQAEAVPVLEEADRTRKEKRSSGYGKDRARATLRA